MLVIIPASSCPSYLEHAKALAKTFLHGNSSIVALTVHTYPNVFSAKASGDSSYFMFAGEVPGFMNKVLMSIVQESQRTPC
jgi:hypothetical protein